MNNQPSTINLGGSGIAQMIYSGHANVLGLGDSILEGYAVTSNENSQSNWPTGIAKEFNPNNWVGWGGQRSESASAENILCYFSTPYTNNDHLPRLHPRDTVKNGGGSDVVSHPWSHSWQFSANYAGSNIERWLFREDDGSTRNFGVGNWFNNKNLIMRLTYRRTPDSLSDVNITVLRGATEYHNSVYDFSGSVSTEYIDIPIENTTGDIEIRIKGGVSDTTGKFLNLLDNHFMVTDEIGFSFHKFMSEGGAYVENLMSSDVSDPSYSATGYISDTVLNRYAEIYNAPNIYFIAIGNNDGIGDFTTTAWKDKVKLVMERCHNASSVLGVTPKFILFSSYAGKESNFSSAAASAHYEAFKYIQATGTSLISPDDIAVVSAHHLMNERNFEDIEVPVTAPWMSDNTHPTMRGVRAVMARLWNVIEAVATSNTNSNSYFGNHSDFS